MKATAPWSKRAPTRRRASAASSKARSSTTLASQGSLALDAQNHLLYAVNAGSNTITVFGVDGDRLQRQQVLPSGGEFPVSVTTHGNLVYVLNARGGGSIQGYVQIGGQLVEVGAWNRTLGLDPTATPEFTHTPGQVAFTPAGSQLVVTTKGNTSSVDVFGVDQFGRPSATPVVNSLPGAVPFAVSFDQAGRLLIAEAGYQRGRLVHDRRRRDR